MEIEIPDELVKRMQRHAIPLVDTPITVIEKWADCYENHCAKAAIPDSFPEQSAVAAMLRLNPSAPPSLLHTIVRGHFGNKEFRKWNDLLRIAHVEAFKKAKTYEVLRKVSRGQIKNGEFSKEGYHYIPEIGISLQGVDADRAWEYALRLAMYIPVTIRAEVEWRNNEKAARPGEHAILEWGEPNENQI